MQLAKPLNQKLQARDSASRKYHSATDAALDGGVDHSAAAINVHDDGTSKNHSATGANFCGGDHDSSANSG